MSSYSSTYPAIRPTYQIDFSNGGRIPPNATFSRSDSPIDATKAAASAVHFWSNEKHLSSDNLLLQSSDFDTTWSANGLNGTPTSGQADPAGGTDGFTLVEDSSTGIHRVSQNVTASGDLALTVYAKQNSGTRYLTLALYYATGNTAMAVYDLAGGSPVTATGASSTYTSVSASQTASGNGYYKCVLKATGSATVAIVNLNDVATTVGLDTNWGTKSYTGDNSSSLDIAFASLSTTGTGYNATTTQIHREYAPTLKSVATAGAARFEYDPTDGQSMGCLIESQATNLVTYSEDFTNWSATRSQVESSAAIGPDGTLSAARYFEDASEGGSNSHYMQSNFTTTNSTQYTMSVYAKDGGGANRYLQLRVMGVGSGFAFANFDLTNGTYVGGGGSIRDSYSISAVGNGWHRLTMTFTNQSSGGTVNGMGIILAAANSELHQYTSDDYSGFLLYGAQCETGSFPSSLVSTSGASATRASDSLSVTDASIFNGGEHSVYWEGSFNGSIIDPRMFSLSDGTNDNRLVVDYNDGNTPRIRGWADGTLHVSESATGQTLPAGSSKIVGTLKTNESRLAINGTQYASDTTGIVVGTMDRMAIGSEHSGGNVLNGHVKRVAYYSTALSQTEIETLTS